MTLQLTEIVGSSLCITNVDGGKVYRQLSQALRNGQRVQISFLNVESVTPTFLNTAIGQLYGEFSEELLRSCLIVTQIDSLDLNLLKQVIETAKLYFNQ